MVNSTVMSLLIEQNGGKVLLERTEKGLSLPGGLSRDLNWSLGFPGSAEEKFFSESGVRIKIEKINGIYHNAAPSGAWATNINLDATLDGKIKDGQKYLWVPCSDIGSYNLRTLDTVAAVKDYFTLGRKRFDLDYLVVTDPHPHAEKELTVSGWIIKSEKGRYLLAYDKGGLTLPGGRVENGELIYETAARESEEEIGYCLTPEGFIGIFVNRAYSDTPINVTNIAPYTSVSESQIDLKAKSSDQDIGKREWFSLEQIRTMPRERFRTADPPIVIERLESLLSSGQGLIPCGFIRKA